MTAAPLPVRSIAVALAMAGALLGSTTAARAEEGNQGPRQVLRWEKVPGVDEYELEIAEDKRFEQVVERHRLKQVYYRWTPLSSRQAYWFRVRSIDVEGREGVFSAPKRVGRTLVAPEAASPSDGALFSHEEKPLKVTLQWRGSPAAATYRVQIARDRSFSKPLLSKDVRGEPALSWRPEGLGTFYWRVRAADSAGQKTPFGGARRFVVDVAAPAPLSPRPRHRVALVPPSSSLTFSWSKRPASVYELQVATDKRFRRVQQRERTRHTRKSIEVSEPGKLHWRVRARREDGQWTDWSRARSVVVASPSLTLLAPKSDAELELPSPELPIELRWEPVRRAASYAVEVVGESGDVVASPEGGDAAAEVSLPAGAYKWRVTALNRGGHAVDASAWSPFVVSLLPPLSSPMPSTPEDGALFGGEPGQLFGLSWENRGEATRFEVEVRREGTSDAFRAAPTERVLVLTPEARGRYRWRVRGLADDGRESEWSVESSFELVAPARLAVTMPEKLQLDRESAAEIVVRVLDDKGRAVDGVSVKGQPSAGQLSAFAREERNTWRARYTPPEADAPSEVAIALTSGALEERRVIELVPPAAPLRLGLRAGALYHFGDVVSPRLDAELVWLLPLLERRVFFSVAASYAFGGRTHEGEAITVSSQVHRIPLHLLGGMRFPLSWGTPYLAGGVVFEPVISVLQVTGQPDHTGVALLVAPEVAGGFVFPLGPGEVAGEVGVAYATHVDGPLALGGAALRTSIGYRFAF